MRTHRKPFLAVMTCATGIAAFAGCSAGTDAPSATEASALSALSAPAAPTATGAGRAVRSFANHLGETEYYAVDAPARGGRQSFAHARTDANGVVLLGSPSPLAGEWTATAIQDVYGIPATGGPSPWVAIIDSEDDPNAESDLAIYRAQYGLPPCTTANGCFLKVNEYGQTSPLPAAAAPSDGQSVESMLDLDMVSAACPTCKILFVEDLGIDSTDVENAWNAAIAFGATYISNSFGIPETSFIGPDGGSAPSASEAWVREQEAFFAAHPTVSFFAGTGDWGYDRHADGSVGMYWPATSAYVTAVGGTTIAETATSPWFSQSAWGSGGAGCSQAIAVPSWQSSSLCNGYRSVADVSAVAQGVSMYDSYGSGGWIGVNGTSVSTPVTAGIYASNGWTGKSPSFSYTSTSLFADVTSGNDCTAATGETCDAGVGYDQPTGNGFPHGSAPVDTFYGAPSSISVPQNGNGFVNLTWAGPWVAQDDGRDATFSFASALYGQYANVSYYESGYAILQLTPTLDATPNVTYPITVTATDLESGVEHSTVVNLTVTQCQQIVCGANQCGTIATTNGCGGSAVECPGCPSGESCSSNVCCPNGKHWDPTDDVCVLTCAAGTEICPATGTCLTSIACNVQSGGGCRKVGNIVECN